MKRVDFRNFTDEELEHAQEDVAFEIEVRDSKRRLAELEDDPDGLEKLKALWD